MVAACASPITGTAVGDFCSAHAAHGGEVLPTQNSASRVPRLGDLGMEPSAFTGGLGAASSAGADAGAAGCEAVSTAPAAAAGAGCEAVSTAPADDRKTAGGPSAAAATAAATAAVSTTTTTASAATASLSAEDVEQVQKTSEIAQEDLAGSCAELCVLWPCGFCFPV